MYTTNNKTYQILKDLLNFFNTSETPEKILAQQSPNKGLFYSMQIIEKNKNFKLDSWIKYVREYTINLGYEDPIQKSYPEGKLLGCSETHCNSFTEEFELFGLSNNSPKSFTQFYDAINSLEKSGKDTNALITDFGLDLNNIIDEETTNYLNKYNFIDFIPTRISLDYDILNDKDYLKKMKKTFKNYINFINNLDDLELYLEILKKVYSTYKNTKIKKLYNKMKVNYDLMYKKYNLFINNIKDDIELLKSKEGQKIMKKMKELWYWDKYIKLKNML